MSERTSLTEAERELREAEFEIRDAKTLDPLTKAVVCARLRSRANRLAARTSTATAGDCEWCNGVDAPGRHENGCRLGLGPDEREFIPLTQEAAPQPEATLVGAKLVGTWSCPDCEGEFPASVVTLEAATADDGLRERVEAAEAALERVRALATRSIIAVHCAKDGERVQKFYADIRAALDPQEPQ